MTNPQTDTDRSTHADCPQLVVSQVIEIMGSWQTPARFIHCCTCVCVVDSEPRGKQKYRQKFFNFTKQKNYQKAYPKQCSSSHKSGNWGSVDTKPQSGIMKDVCLMMFFSFFSLISGGRIYGKTVIIESTWVSSPGLQPKPLPPDQHLML